MPNTKTKTKTKKTKKIKKGGKTWKPTSNSTLPPVEVNAYPAGTQSANEAAHYFHQSMSKKQNESNLRHLGGNINNKNKVIVPQASTHGMRAVSKYSGNSNATLSAQSSLQANSDRQFDELVGKDSPSTIGGRRFKRTLKKKRKKKKKSKKGGAPQTKKYLKVRCFSGGIKKKKK